jgi:hypothetical protein
MCAENGSGDGIAVQLPTEALFIGPAPVRVAPAVISPARSTSARRRISIEGGIYR